MLYHKYDPNTLLYIESVESDEQPENSVSGKLPDQTEHYTLAFTEDSWVSVLRPELEIVNGKIQEKASEEPPALEDQPPVIEG